MIRFRCPECGKEYETPDESAGKKTRCNKCEATFRIPDDEPQEAERLPPKKPPNVAAGLFGISVSMILVGCLLTILVPVILLSLFCVMGALGGGAK